MVAGVEVAAAFALGVSIPKVLVLVFRAYVEGDSWLAPMGNPVNIVPGMPNGIIPGIN